MNNSSAPPCLEQLYIDHFSLLYRLACNQLIRYTGSATDASDMVQDVFLLAAHRWPMLKEHPNPVGWLIKATHFVCMNHAEAQYRQQAKENHYKAQVLQKQPKAYGPLYTEAIEDETSAQNVLISLEQMLKPEDYEILKAYCIDKRSMEDITHETGLSAVALRVRIHRIRQEIIKNFILLVTFLAVRNI